MTKVNKIFLVKYIKNVVTKKESIGNDPIELLMVILSQKVEVPRTFGDQFLLTFSFITNHCDLLLTNKFYDSCLIIL